MTTKLSHRSNLLFLLLFIVVSLFVYRYERYGIEGAQYTDHKVFMAVREAVESDAAFLGQVISFDRIREKASNFLFRPGLGLYLGLMDIFFRDHFSIWGLGSILLNGLCGWIVFLLLRRMAIPRGVSTTLAILFTVHYSGSPIVVWRHISAYILGLSFFALGLGEIARGPRPRLGCLVFYLFFSSLFHENTAFALVPLLLFVVVSSRYAGARWQWNSGEPFTRKDCFALGGVSAAYFFLSLVDLVLRNPPGGAFANHPLFERTVPGVLIYLAKAAANTVLVAGSFPAAYFIPQSNQLEWGGQKLVYGLCGVALLLLLGRMLWIKMRAKKEERLFTLSPLWFAGAYLFSLSLSLGSVRLVHNGYYYLSHSRYYQYFGNFLWTLVFAMGLKRLLDAHRRRWVMGLVLVILFNQLFFSIARHRRVGLITHQSEKEQAAVIWTASQAIGKSECLAGPGKAEWESRVPFVFLYRKSCAVRKSTPITTDILQSRVSALK